MKKMVPVSFFKIYSNGLLLILMIAARCVQANPEGMGNISLEDRTKAVMEKTGDLVMIQANFRSIEELVIVFLSSLSPENSDKIRNVISPVFDDAHLLPKIQEKIAIGIRPEDISAIESWADLPSTEKIQKAIINYTGKDANKSVGGQEREKMLVRLAKAMCLTTSQEHSDEIKLLTMSMDAMDPSLSASYDVGRNIPMPSMLTNEDIAAQWLNPALSEIADEDLVSYLDFSESEAGFRYFSANCTLVGAVVRSYLQPTLVAVISKELRMSVVPPQNETADSLFNQAMRLKYEFGTRVVMAEMVDLLRQADQLKPNDSDILNELGEAALVMRDGVRADVTEIRAITISQYTDQAQGYFKRVIALDPNNAKAITGLGVIEFLLGKDQEAAKYFAKAASLNPQVPELMLFKADLAAESGDNENAFGVYEQLLKNENLPRATHAGAFLHAIVVLDRLNRIGEFAPIGLAYINKYPKDYSMQIQYAHYILRAGLSPIEAIMILKNVPKTWSPTEKSHYLGLAYALAANEAMKAKDEELAKKYVALAINETGSGKEIGVYIQSFPNGADAAAVIAKYSMDPGSISSQLGISIMTNDYASAKAMLDLGGDPNGLDITGNNHLLESALMFRNDKIFELLLQYGADASRPLRDGRTIRQFIKDSKMDNAEAFLESLDSRSIP